MKLESLEKFSKNEINKVEMNNVFGGVKALVSEGWATKGATDVCTGLGCGSYSSDWEDKNGIWYENWVPNNKPC
jgi:hypothetical protein